MDRERRLVSCALQGNGAAHRSVRPRQKFSFQNCSLRGATRVDRDPDAALKREARAPAMISSEQQQQQQQQQHHENGGTTTIHGSGKHFLVAGDTDVQQKDECHALTWAVTMSSSFAVQQAFVSLTSSFALAGSAVAKIRAGNVSKTDSDPKISSRRTNQYRAVVRLQQMMFR